MCFFPTDDETLKYLRLSGRQDHHGKLVEAYSKELFFFFKQKTAYEMLLCDWSSDVCSSDLMIRHTRCCCVTGVQTCALPICSFPEANAQRSERKCGSRNAERG